MQIILFNVAESLGYSSKNLLDIHKRSFSRSSFIY